MTKKNIGGSQSETGGKQKNPTDHSMGLNLTSKQGDMKP